MECTASVYGFFVTRRKTGKAMGIVHFSPSSLAQKIAISAYVDIRGNGFCFVITGFHYLSFCGNVNTID